MLKGLGESLDNTTTIFDYQSTYFLLDYWCVLLKVFALFNDSFCLTQRGSLMILSDHWFENLGRSDLRNLWDIFCFTKTLQLGILMDEVRAFLKLGNVPSLLEICNLISV